MTEFDWMTLREACRYIKVSRSTLYSWERAGKLSLYRFGRSVRIRREDIHRLAVARRNQE
jgi:excisionase family DNA binding protein